MPTCQSKRKDGQPCRNRVSEGKTYCQWHKPDEVEDWRKVYERLKKASPKEKRDIVLLLIKDHPNKRLDLPQHDEIHANLEDANLSGLNLIGANLQGINFYRTNLQDAKLGAANLQKAALIYTDLQRAELQGANLQDAVITYANLQGANLEGADLQRANLTHTCLRGAVLRKTKLRGSRLWATDMQNADLEFADLQGADLGGANLQGANLKKAKLQQVDLELCKIDNIFIWGAWLDKTRLRRKQLGRAIGEELAGDYGYAKHGYLTLKQNFDDLGDYGAASWAYRKERRMEKLTHWPPSHIIIFYKKWLPKLNDKSWRGKFQRFSFYLRQFASYISDWFVELLCDYGESIWRVVAWIAAVLFVIGPALVGWRGQLKWPEENYSVYFSLPTAWQQWGYAYVQNVLYMLDTFTTANFAQLEPANDLVRLISGFLAMIGIFLVGLLGFVVGNRIRRS